MKHQPMKYEYMKFHNLRPRYEAGLKEILNLNFEKKDYVHHFPAFAGHLTLARFLSMYEAYKMVLGVAGHIAEVGVGTGTSSIYFAKLTKIFEPNSITLVHGFDWFQGVKPTKEEKFLKEGDYKVEEKIVYKLIQAQGLDNILHIHNLDASKELGAFFKKNNHMQFKLVFLDCGMHDVVAESLKHFWPRLTPGGVLLLDHYSFELAPAEIRAVRELLPHVKFKQFSFGWMPAAYAVKQ